MKPEINRQDLINSLTQFKQNKISAEVMADTIISAIELSPASIPVKGADISFEEWCIANDYAADSHDKNGFITKQFKYYTNFIKGFEAGQFAREKEIIYPTEEQIDEESHFDVCVEDMNNEVCFSRGAKWAIDKIKQLNSK